jgi:hypothetical protein
MSKNARRRQRRPSACGPAASPATFTPVAVRPRHDGWTPARQIAFVQSLAACANVEEACRAVGMSPHSYYDLKRRPDAGSFRAAVEAALDVAVDRLADRMLARAMNGVSTPIMYKGEQVSERVRYDERLAMFILRTRAPERYGKWRDGVQYTREHPDGAALLLQQALRDLAEDGQADAAGRPRPQRPPLKRVRLLDDPAEIDAMAQARERQRREEAHAAHLAWLETASEQTRRAILASLPPRDDGA